MKIRLEDIPEEGLDVAFQIGADRLTEQLVNPRDPSLLFERPADSTVVLTREAGELRIRGSARATFQNVCARCLEPVECHVVPDFNVTKTLGMPSGPLATQDEEEEGEGHGEGTRPEEIYEDYLAGDEVDLDEVVVEQIAVHLPFKIVCREECKGLCPRCGSNLNESPCVCPPERQETPFSVLGKLKLG